MKIFDKINSVLVIPKYSNYLVRLVDEDTDTNYRIDPDMLTCQKRNHETTALRYDSWEARHLLSHECKQSFINDSRKTLTVYFKSKS